MGMRYPGAKGRHTSVLQQYVPESATLLCEPFAGTCALSLALVRAREVPLLWINDLDYGIYALWSAIRCDPERLLARIEDYTPMAEDFYEFKSVTGDLHLDGFRRLALHQLSYSGLGPRAGSPIGGRNQSGPYTANCRWNAKRLGRWVIEISNLLPDDTWITNYDCLTVLESASDAPPGTFVYLDPPYFTVGERLYVEGVDHEKLSEQLRGMGNWLLSYDDCAEVRDMYSWAKIVEFPVRSSLHHRKINDLIITPW